jgi:hypothetical protein
MSTFHRYALGVLACLVVLAIFQLAPAQGDAAKGLQKWEYLTTDADSSKAMNEWGKQGWELVCVTKTRSDQPTVAYFKRSK